MRIYDLIAKKRDGGTHSREELEAIVNGFVSGEVADYQMAAWMMAVYLRGMTDEEINAKFGFLVDAYKYGAPPHGGAGIGLDRLAMLMCGCDSLRDVTAFPKVQNASDLMMNCPDVVDQKQLDDLAIAVTRVEEAAAEEE